MATKKYLDDNGLLFFWGKLKSIFLTAVGYDTTNKKLTVTKNGTASDLVTAAKIVEDGGGITDVSGKADKVSSPTSGNFAGLDANGNLIDSGKKASDFLSSEDLSSYAPLNSPALTGTPTAPTASSGTNNTQIATTAFVKAAVQEALVGGFVVVSTLPTASADTMGKIYLVPNAGSGTNAKDEYVTIRSGSAGSYTYSWELFGTTQIDLTGYVKESDLVAITNAEIETIVAS